MDTMLLYPEKRILNVIGIAVNFTVIGAFVLTQSMFTPLSAQDMIANLSNPVVNTGQASMQIFNEFSSDSELKKFNERVEKKYPKGTIFNVDDGIKHIKLTKYFDGKPVKINIVEINKKIAKDYDLVPALASDKLATRKTITSIAKDTNSIVALNGTFFKPQTGVPLGTLMIDGKMYTGPIYDRVAIGFFDNGYDIARVQLNASLRFGKNELKVDNINQPRMLSTYILAYTPDWGKLSPATPKYGLQIAVENNKVKEISSTSLQIPENGYVISGPESTLRVLNIGDKVKLSIKTNPEWHNVKHIVSGGPYLVKNGDVFVDIAEEKLGAIGGKNPRSAIGYTEDNDLILVAVDGREGNSVGLTLTQLAGFMKSIGCTNAINLDGGGSTVMYVNGNIVNSPQIKGGIPLSNALVLSHKS